MLTLMRVLNVKINLKKHGESRPLPCSSFSHKSRLTLITSVHVEGEAVPASSFLNGWTQTAVQVNQ